MVAAAFVSYWHTWIRWVLERYYGAIDGHWLRALLHASYDKPNFVTQNSLAVMLIVGRGGVRRGLCHHRPRLAGAAVARLAPSWRPCAASPGDW